MTTAGKRRYNDVWEARRALAGRTQQVEEAVRRAYRQHLEPVFREDLAVLAVGGFGRRELFPYSDVDLVLLVASPWPVEPQRTAIDGFLQALWDGGQRVSHSVRTVGECCEWDGRNAELSISLLDARLVAGDAVLHARLEENLPRFVHSQRHALAARLCRQARERHAEQGGTTCQLEPDLKEAPGGLRDYHLVNWLGRLRGAPPERLPAPEPPGELEAARDFLFWLRCCAHAASGRDFNRLTFDLQEELAGEEAAELMRQYLWHARRIHRAACLRIDAAEEQLSSLLVQFRDWRSRIANAEFFVSRERIYVRQPQQLVTDPPITLRLFEFVARHGFRLAPDTERRLAEQLRPLRQYFAEPRALWPQLRGILAAPHAPLALRAMQDSGVLGAVFAEWGRIDCLVLRDFYHRCTVDEHSLRAVETLAELRRTGEPGDRFAGLLAEVEDPEAIALALLFHDTGKSDPSAEHVIESARLAEQAMERIRVPPAPRKMVRRLIDLHGVLAAVMQTRDLDDSATARWVADRVETLEVLKRLALMTYADISAVHPGAMTSWRREQLWRLYLATYHELARELTGERIPPASVAEPEWATFLEGFPVRYLRTHSKAEIQAHRELERRSRGPGVAVDLRKDAGAWVLTILTRERPFLLASLAGALSSFGMNILKAEGFANREGRVLDTFTFADPHRTLELNPTEEDRLRVMIERVALGKKDVRELLRSRPRPRPPSRAARVEPVVSFDAEVSESATLIEIVAADRPGLLHDLAQTLSTAGCNIELVLADTQAHKALDVFYVTSEGRKLTREHQENLRASLLAVCAG